MTLGKRIRQLRLEQRRTLQEVADACGFTISHLSKIETDKTVPAVATLMKIAKQLGVKVSVLMEDDGDSKTALTPLSAVAEDKMVQSEKGYAFVPMAAEFRDKQMQPFLFVARKGEINTGNLSHSGEEFVYILEGESVIKVGDNEYFLRTGESLYFDSAEEHELVPLSDRVKYLAVFLPR